MNIIISAIFIAKGTLFGFVVAGKSGNGPKNPEENGYYEGDMLGVYETTCSCVPRYGDHYFADTLTVEPVGTTNGPPGTGPGRYPTNNGANNPAVDKETTPISPPPRNKGVPWTDGIVPYAFVPRDGRHAEIAMVENMMRAIEQKSAGCVQFVPFDGSQTQVVSILLPSKKDKYANHCASHVGMQPVELQPQHIILGPSCFKKNGTIVHELMHTLGFHHEHTRPDRDEHLDIFWTSIKPEAKVYFNKYTPASAKQELLLQLPFDYESIMFLDCYAFSTDNSWLTTLMPNKPLKDKQVGQRMFLSAGDEAKLITMYCPAEDLGFMTPQL